MARPAFDPRRFVLASAAGVAALAVITGVVGLLESSLAIPDASAVYLLAVVGIAVAFGTTPAVATAIGAFLLYDYFYTEPRYTLTVRDPGEWLNVLLLLVVGTVVGRLAGRQRARADAALAREREARALFNVSFALAEGHDTSVALPTISLKSCAERRARRVRGSPSARPWRRIPTPAPDRSPIRQPSTPSCWRRPGPCAGRVGAGARRRPRIQERAHRRRGCVQGVDHDREPNVRCPMGHPSETARRPGSRRHPGSGRCRRPDRRRARAGTAASRRDSGRDLTSERGPQIGVAVLDLSPTTSGPRWHRSVRRPEP